MIFYYLGGEVNALYREGAVAFNGQAALDRLRDQGTAREGVVSVYELPLDMAHILRGITNRQKLKERITSRSDLLELLHRMEKGEHTGTLEIQCTQGAAMILLVRGRISNTYWETSGGLTYEKGEARQSLEQALEKPGDVHVFLSEFSRDIWKSRHEVQDSVRSRLEKRDSPEATEQVAAEEVVLRHQALDEPLRGAALRGPGLPVRPADGRHPGPPRGQGHLRPADRLPGRQDPGLHPVRPRPHLERGTGRRGGGGDLHRAHGAGGRGHPRDAGGAGRAGGARPAHGPHRRRHGPRRPRLRHACVAASLPAAASRPLPEPASGSARIASRVHHVRGDRGVREEHPGPPPGGGPGARGGADPRAGSDAARPGHPRAPPGPRSRRHDARGGSAALLRRPRATRGPGSSAPPWLPAGS